MTELLQSEKRLSVQSSHAAHSGSGYSLPVSGVGHITGSEHTRHVSLGAVPRDEVAVVVAEELTFEEIGLRGVADGYEGTFDLKPFGAVWSGELEVSEAARVVRLTTELGNLCVPEHLDLGVSEEPLLQDLLGLEVTLTDDESDLGAEIGEVKGFLDGSVAATDDSDGRVLDPGGGGSLGRAFLKKKPSQVAQAEIPKPL